MNKLIFVPESRYDEMRTAEANYKTMAEINKGLEAENERLRYHRLRRLPLCRGGLL